MRILVYGCLFDKECLIDCSEQQDAPPSSQNSHKGMDMGAQMLWTLILQAIGKLAGQGGLHNCSPEVRRRAQGTDNRRSRWLLLFKSLANLSLF